MIPFGEKKKKGLLDVFPLAKNTSFKRRKVFSRSGQKVLHVMTKGFSPRTP